jgi:GNAT superfamily N-acetyltransferase
MEMTHVRKGTKADLKESLALIQELAVYEKEPEAVVVSVEQMEAWGFQDNPFFEFYVAVQNEQIVGIAFYYIRYSTWKGPMIYLEDIVVKEEVRGNGIGARLFEAVAIECAKRNFHGMTWQVLDWNEPALNFYRKYSATFSAEWLNGYLFTEQIKEATWHK